MTNEFFNLQVCVNAKGKKEKPPVGWGKEWKSFTKPGEGIPGASVLP